MARRTISVGRKTWEALSSLGKFGQSFDDVIQILLQEHEELKRLKAQLVSQSQQPSFDYGIRGAVEEFIEAAKEANPELYKVFEQRIKQETQPQPQQPQESTVDPYPNPEDNPILLNIYMPKTKYPATKNEILELPGWKLAQRIEEFLHNELGYSVDNRLLRETAIMNNCTYDIIKIIPNKKYNTKQELQNTVREVYNKNDNELKQIHGGKDALSVNISDYTPDLGDNENEITKKFYESLNEGEKELIRGLKSPTF